MTLRRQSKFTVALGTCALLTMLTGCTTNSTGVSVANGKQAETSVTNTSTMVSNGTAGSNTTVDPVVYLTCKKVYTDVAQAVKDNKNVAFDNELAPITQVGQDSPKGSATNKLYIDTATLVALHDAFNSEGAPASAERYLNEYLAKVKEDLQKYQPGKQQ